MLSTFLHRIRPLSLGKLRSVQLARLHTLGVLQKNVVRCLTQSSSGFPGLHIDHRKCILTKSGHGRVTADLSLFARSFSASNALWRDGKRNQKEEDEGKENEKKNDWRTNSLRIATFMAVVYLWLTIYGDEGTSQDAGELPGIPTISWTEFINECVKKGEVKEVVIYPNSEDGEGSVLVELHDGAIVGGRRYSGRGHVKLRLAQKQFESLEDQIRHVEKGLGVSIEGGIPVRVHNDRSSTAVKYIILGLALLIAIPIGLRYVRGLVKTMPSASEFLSGSKKFKRADLTVHGTKIKFKDVAGLKEAKIEVKEFVDYLKSPKRFQVLGARIPSGVLLTGPPGCGKTLLAKAMAGEAGVPFLVMAGSEFVEVVGGVGAQRVRDLFKEARKVAPCIVYIDEVDAIGRKRSGASDQSGSSSEANQTLNQLLVELDGMETDKTIIMLASTNREDVLDKALLRPGRFDRHILVDYPTLIDRNDLFSLYLSQLKLHSSASAPPEVEAAQTAERTSDSVKSAQKEPQTEAEKAEHIETMLHKYIHKNDATMLKEFFEKDHPDSKKKMDDMKKMDDVITAKKDTAPKKIHKIASKPDEALVLRLAQLTTGMTGADIANVCNEGALYAARQGADSVTAEHLMYAHERVVAGMVKKSGSMSGEERNVVSYHEAGHALVSWMLESTDSLLKVSIAPRTSARQGFTQFLPSDKKLYSKEDLFEKMVVALGGRAAEAVVFNRITTGAHDDLQKVTKMAYSQVRSYGMSDSIGQLSFPEVSENEFAVKPYSKLMQHTIDEESRVIVGHAYRKAESLLNLHRDMLDKLSGALLAKETLTYEDICALIGPPPHQKAPPPSQKPIP